MKLFIVFLSIVFGSALTTVGQDSAKRGLSIFGNVAKIDSTCLNGKASARIQLYLQFRNDSDSNLLILRPSFLFEKRVNFVKDPNSASSSETVLGEGASYDPYLDNPFGSRSSDDYDPMPPFLRDLRSSDEPFKQIEPGKYYEFQDVVWMKNGFRLDSKSRKIEVCKEGNSLVTPAYPSFTIEYHFSVKKFDHETELLSTLKERWKPFGNFVLDSNGDISYKSAKITLPNND